ncbi:hypothetical protein CsSME_00051005 [Camellia sinensis var. sinensis]
MSPWGKRLLVVANRLPVSAVRRGTESWSLEISTGGLVSAFLGVKEFEARWIGWAGVNVPDKAGQKALFICIPVFLDEEIVHCSAVGELFMILLCCHYVATLDMWGLLLKPPMFLEDLGLKKKILLVVVEFVLTLQEVRCFSVVLECVLAPVAIATASALRTPTIGSGQVN